MKAECVDSKDAPEGYYAVKVDRSMCFRCDLANEAYGGIGCSANCDGNRRADRHSVIFKKLPKHSALAEKRLYVHSEDGHVVLAFGGEMQSTPCIAILNYADAPAKDIAQHLMTLWNENANKTGDGSK